MSPIPMLLSLVLIGQPNSTPGSLDKTEDDFSEFRKAAAKLAGQYPADFTTDQKVIAYGGGYPVNASTNAEDLMEINRLLADGALAKMKGNKDVEKQIVNRLNDTMQALQEKKRSFSLKSGTLLEVISSRWTKPSTNTLLTLPVPGKYLYEVRVIDPELKSPAKSFLANPMWVDEDCLVATTPRLVPPVITSRTERSMTLSYFFSKHQREEARVESGSEAPAIGGTNSQPNAAIFDPTRPLQPARRSQSPSQSAVTTEPDNEQELSVAIVDHTEGLVDGRYKIYIEIRNSSGTTLRFLKMTALYKTSSNRLLHTDWAFANPRTVKPGETTVIELSTSENVDSIHHYDVKFESSNRNVKFTLPTR